MGNDRHGYDASISRFDVTCRCFPISRRMFSELWDDVNGRPVFRATMSLDRFKEITRCLRFDDKEDHVANRSRDKLAPIRTVFDKWNNRLKLLYVPGKFLTVDEQLVPFRGRTPFTQYMPSKPAGRYGDEFVVLFSQIIYDYDYNIIGMESKTGSFVMLRLAMHMIWNRMLEEIVIAQEKKTWAKSLYCG